MSKKELECPYYWHKFVRPVKGGSEAPFQSKLKIRIQGKLKSSTKGTEASGK
jgi:hypothetical protein